MSTVAGTATGAATATATDTVRAERGEAGPLSGGLRDALDTVRIASDGRTAWVGDDEITAESPPAMRFTLARTLYEVLHTGRGIRDRKAPKTLRAPEYEARIAEATPTRRPSRPPSSPGGGRPPGAGWWRSTVCAWACPTRCRCGRPAVRSATRRAPWS